MSAPQLRTLAAHQLLYFAPVLLQAVVGLMSVPVLISAMGIEEYPYAASGQAIGAVAWILLSFGYQATGPARLATNADETVRSLLGESMIYRLAIAPAVLGTAVIAAWVVAPNHFALAGGFAVSTALAGFTSAWLFVAVADPLGALRYEAVPRVLPCVAGLAITACTGNVGTFVVGQVVGVAWSALATARYACRRNSRPRAGTRGRNWRSVVPNQARMAALTTTAAVSGTLPLLILTARAYPIRVDFAVLDKLHKQSTGAMVPVSSALLSGHGLRPAADIVRLARRNARLLWVLFGCVAVGLLTIAGPAVAILSSGEVHLSGAERAVLALWISTTGLAQAWVPCVLALTGRDRLGLVVILLASIATSVWLATSPPTLALTPILLTLSGAQILLPVLTWPRRG